MHACIHGEAHVIMPCCITHLSQLWVSWVTAFTEFGFAGSATARHVPSGEVNKGMGPGGAERRLGTAEAGKAGTPQCTLQCVHWPYPILGGGKPPVTVIQPGLCYD